MIGRFTRRRFLQAGATAAAGLGVAGSLALPQLAPGIARAADKKFTIALSNSFIGNKWRIEMENVFKAALQMEPFASQVEGSWFNSGNDVSKQSQQISNLIAKKVDAIVVNAASPTGLNGILTQATQRGILVVSFDNIVTAPSVLKVNTDQVEFGKKLAQWLVDKLGGKGNVIMVTGVAGTSVDLDRNKGADEVWKANPGIKVVNRYTGMWDSSTAERNTTAILPSLPQIDGIWCQGGTDGVLKAFIAAKRPLPPTAGEAENGFRKFMIGYDGHKVDGISIGQPPFLSVISLELARRVLAGTYPKKDITIPFPYVTNDTVKVGETVFPDLPDSFFADFTDSGPDATVKMCIDGATDGKACPGELNVKLPPA
ncbi:monosaccharide ABC transporter substrate-binding protein, CUT2 family [Tistlia consotensis]|uniref:Monosaccharide ABC transporter substrate-binding protein, CUT2 family n=1 Tax=Tistlia consotensis USBA 355 TaxID=560819 RepID=A0A1Y6CPS3_9PROT|nr:sugar ABC transporter substrate-binding protein [Tistlia consotensis]SMF64496.1 monosaccharide ABC transporter substrate-binding protein, CUT2 family [Tistlia consotensis USBA 355]SNR97387.1 monosaccharide ABC transporter substrate-binding protein, CUT2 family [Tistlia consotensis]